MTFSKPISSYTATPSMTISTEQENTIYWVMLTASLFIVIWLIWIVDQMANVGKKNHESLEDRMKHLEHNPTPSGVLDNTKPVVMRLDGRKFSKLTKSLKSREHPYNVTLSACLVNCVGDLMNEFGADVGYTQSDEISLVWYPHEVRSPADEPTLYKELIFGGRVQKLCSVVAAYCTARFNHYVQNPSECKISQMMVGRGIEYFDIQNDLKFSNRTPHFDARIWNMPSEQEVLNYFIWRSKHDSVRNSISGLAQRYFSPKKLHYVTVDEQLRMLKQEHNIDWDDSLLSIHKYGAFVKKELVEKGRGENGNPILRSGNMAFQITFDDIREPLNRVIILDLLRSKYVENNHVEFLGKTESKDLGESEEAEESEESSTC